MASVVIPRWRGARPNCVLRNGSESDLKLTDSISNDVDTCVYRDAKGNHAGTRHSSGRAPARRRLADRYADSLRSTVSRLNEDLRALAACCKAQDLRFALAERMEV